jgi:hypothetical protein
MASRNTRKRPQVIIDLATVPDPYDPKHQEKILFPPERWCLKDLAFLMTLAEQPIRGGKTLLRQLQPESDSDSDSSSDEEKKPIKK